MCSQKVPVRVVLTVWPFILIWESSCEDDENVPSSRQSNVCVVVPRRKHWGTYYCHWLVTSLVWLLHAPFPPAPLPVSWVCLIPQHHAQQSLLLKRMNSTRQLDLLVLYEGSLPIPRIEVDAESTKRTLLCHGMPILCGHSHFVWFDLHGAGEFLLFFISERLGLNAVVSLE